MTFFDDHLGARPAMAILRGYTPSRTVELCERAADLGFGLIEVPVQDSQGMVSLEAAVDWGRSHDRRPIGAGTVTTTALIADVARIGAAFTVAPNIDPDIVRAARAAGLSHLPGVATATEVQIALAAGCAWQKAFPAAALGADWISAMRGPFPQARFVATGGVTPANARDFLAAGAAISLGAAFAGATSEEIVALGLQQVPR